MRLRSDEKLGLAAAVVLHGALVAVLLMQAVRSDVAVFPERMTVSLAADVGLENASPDPVSESRASVAPTLAPEAAPAPEPVKPDPRTAASQPARDRSRPDRQAPGQTGANQPKPASKTGGGSRVGEDFLDGKGSSATTQETRAPAATFGAKEAADLRSAISRQIKRNWTAPSGVEVPDGSLKGRPTCRTKPESITQSNRPQASLHCERAIRAVQLADFSNLPEQFYTRWDDLEWQFDRRL